MGFTYPTAEQLKENFDKHLKKYSKDGLAAIPNETRRKEWALLGITIETALALKKENNNFPASEIVAAIAILLQEQMNSSWNYPQNTDTYKAISAIIGISETNPLEEQDELNCRQKFHGFDVALLLNKILDSFAEKQTVNEQKLVELLSVIYKNFINNFYETKATNHVGLLEEAIKKTVADKPQTATEDFNLGVWDTNNTIKKAFNAQLKLYTNDRNISDIPSPVRQNEWNFLAKIINNARGFQNRLPEYNESQLVAAALMLLKNQLQSSLWSSKSTKTYNSFSAIEKKLGERSRYELLRTFMAFYYLRIFDSEKNSIRSNPFTEGQELNFLSALCTQAIKALAEEEKNKKLLEFENKLAESVSKLNTLIHTAKEEKSTSDEQSKGWGASMFSLFSKAANPSEASDKAPVVSDAKPKVEFIGSDTDFTQELLEAFKTKIGEHETKPTEDSANSAPLSMS